MGFAFTYNSLVCSGATARLPDGPFAWSREGTAARFGCDVLVASSGAAGLASECTTFETAMAAHDAALLVTLDGATLISLDPATNSGFRVRPTLRKSGSTDDSERSRRYRLEIAAEQPASAIGHSGGFIEESVAMAMDAAGRHTITFAGAFTAEGGDSARDSYADATSGAGARATTWLDAFGSASDYELLREDTEEDAAATRLAYTRVYRERLIPETAAGSADSSFRIDSLALSRSLDGRASASYSLAFAATVDAAAHDYAALQSLYEGTIKPALLQRLRDVWLAGSRLPVSHEPLLDDERVTIDAAASRVSANWTVLAAAGSLLAFELRTRSERQSRIKPRKVLDGRPHTHVLTCAGESWRARVTVRAESINQPADITAAGYAPPKPAGAEDAVWVLTGSITDDESHPIAPHQTDLGAGAVRHSRTCTFDWLLVAEPTGEPLVVPITPLIVG